MESTKLNDETLDRLIAKAERLEAILTRCENFVEALDDGATPAPVYAQAAELKQASPQINFTVSLGNIDAIMKAPAGAFAPEFMEMLEQTLPRVFNPREKKPEPDVTKSGEYKKGKGLAKDNIIIGQA